MPFASLLKDIPGVATGLALASLALLILKVLVLNHILGFFSGAKELGGVVDAVLASVVASYIFFVIVVHVPSARDRLLVRSHVARHTRQVITYCRQQLNAIGSAASRTLELESLSPSELTSAFKQIDPNGEAPMVLSPGNERATWFQYLGHHVERSDASIARTLANVHFIDADLVRRLTDIEDSSYFVQMRLISGMPLRNKDLSVWADSFIEYCARCRALNQYCNSAWGPDAP